MTATRRTSTLRPVSEVDKAQKKTQPRGDQNSTERGYAKGRNTRRHIVEVASRVFAAYGYRGSTYDQIASEAGMTKGAVSGHFKRKHDLYVASIKHGLAFFGELAEIGENLPPEEGLLSYLRVLGSYLSADSDARALLIQLIRDVDDDVRAEIIRTVLSPPFVRIRKLIEAVNPRIDSAAYSFIVFSSLLLDADQHKFYMQMAEDKGLSHDMSATIRRLLGIIRTAAEY